MELEIDDVTGCIHVRGGRPLAAFLRKLGPDRARALGGALLSALADPKTMRLVELGLVEEAAHRAMLEGRQKTCSVTIAGAGPGGLGNLTLVVLDRIRSANVLYTDALVDVEVLEEAMPEARVVEVGARCGFERSTSPEEIAHEMASAARRGVRVLRLHGGDPSLFARMLEEVRTLEALGVEAEILPGVSALAASAAAARAPLTARGIASGVSVRTGHTARGYTRGEIDPNEETVVVMMGLGALASIAAGLIAEGRPERTPAVVVSRAGRRDQRVVRGTLGSIAIVAGEAKVESPATLIVGDVLR